jgi:acetyl-CoA carboxylase biotin carboxyl carrier protein
MSATCRRRVVVVVVSLAGADSGLDEEEEMAEEIRAEMVANVMTVSVSEGDDVHGGDSLALLDSMKMEIPVLSEATGEVSAVAVKPGEVVQEGDLIAVVE